MANEPAPEKLNVAGVLDRLLAYASSPWKAVVVLIAIVICGAGWLIWTERTRIADAILTSAHQRAELNEAAFLADAPTLLRDTRADYALLVETSIIDNTMTDRVGVDTDGNRWVPSVGPAQALAPASSMPMLVKFLANEPVCTDTAVAINDDAKALGAKGYQRVCMIDVPPILGIGIGGLVVAWKQPPLASTEQRAGIAMKSAAMKFATW